MGLWQDRRARKQRQAAAADLYAAAVAAARQPVFYAQWGVADTVDGRFDMIVLHLFLLHERLGSDENKPTPGRALGRVLNEVMIRDMDQSLREMGAGDMGVPRRIKAMAQAMMGRLQAYHDADGEAGLWQAICRNVYRGTTPPADAETGFLAYLRQCRAGLAAQDDASLCAGQVSLPPAQEVSHDSAA